MANILYANNAAGTLAAGIASLATSLTLNAGQGAAFPLPVPPQVFYVTLTDAATQTLIEIVKVTAVAGDVFSLVRAQDGTSALSWNAGDIVSQRAIRLEMQGWENAAEGLFGPGGQNVVITPSSTLGIAGTTTNDDAQAGSAGEYVSQTAPAASFVPATIFNAVSQTLSAGDWDVQGTVQFTPAAGVTATVYQAGLSIVSNTFGPVGTFFQDHPDTGSPQNFGTFSTPVVRFSLSAPTVVQLVVFTLFTGGTLTGNSFLRARRVR